MLEPEVQVDDVDPVGPRDLIDAIDPIDLPETLGPLDTVDSLHTTDPVDPVRGESGVRPPLPRRCAGDRRVGPRRPDRDGVRVRGRDVLDDEILWRTSVLGDGRGVDTAHLEGDGAGAGAPRSRGHGTPAAVGASLAPAGWGAAPSSAPRDSVTATADVTARAGTGSRRPRTSPS